ncbi:hypothetical protein I317_01430 [Kwoniella heveanensis CBS 569]|nr:hypothetical protein I317_01430 [Kwoniella heveanensis CBS 569]
MSVSIEPSTNPASEASRSTRDSPSSFTRDQITDGFDTLRATSKQLDEVARATWHSTNGIVNMKQRSEADRRSIIDDDAFKAALGEDAFLTYLHLEVSKAIGLSARPSSAAQSGIIGEGQATEYQPVLQLTDILVPPSATATEADKTRWLRGQAERFASEYRESKMALSSRGYAEPPALDNIRDEAVSSVLGSYKLPGPDNDKLQASRSEFASTFQLMDVNDAIAVYEEMNYRRNIGIGFVNPSSRTVFCPTEKSRLVDSTSADCTSRACHLSEAVLAVQSELNTAVQLKSSMMAANPRLPDNMREWVKSKQPPRSEEFTQRMRDIEAAHDRQASKVRNALNIVFDSHTDGSTVAGDTDLSAAFQLPGRVHEPKSAADPLEEIYQAPGYPPNAIADLSNVTMELYNDPTRKSWTDLLPPHDYATSLAQSIIRGEAQNGSVRARYAH